MDENEIINRLSLYERKIIRDIGRRFLSIRRREKGRFVLLRLPLVLLALYAIYGAFRYQQATLKFPKFFGQYPDLSLPVYGFTIAVCLFVVGMFFVDLNAAITLFLKWLFRVRRNQDANQS